MKLAIRPLTPDLWPAFEDLFGQTGACNGCWCLYWRIGSAYTKRPRAENKADFRRIVKRGPRPACSPSTGSLPSAVGRWVPLLRMATHARIARVALRSTSGWAGDQ